MFFIFWVSVILLSQLYFKPFQKLFQMREKSFSKDRESAELSLAEAKKAISEYEAQLKAARLKAVGQFSVIEKTLKADFEKNQLSIRESQKQEMLKLQTQLIADREKLLVELKPTLSGLVQRLSQKLLSN
jgi:F0F1-type ATP synthase membrane subunit b/b'